MLLSYKDENAVGKQRKVLSGIILELIHRQKLIAMIEMRMKVGERCDPKRRTISWFPELPAFLLMF